MSSEEIKLNYINWLESLPKKKQELSRIDMECFLKKALKKYKREFNQIDYNTLEKLYELYENNLTKYGEGRYHLDIYRFIGYKALINLKDNDWLKYRSLSDYENLLERCVLQYFCNLKEVKKLLK